MRCVFRDCSEPVLSNSDKCAFHKNRRLCSVIGCENQVYARKLCVKHGARKRCSFPKCRAYTQGHAACPDHHVWLPQGLVTTDIAAVQSEQRRWLCRESLDAVVVACTPQWLDAIDLAWLDVIERAI
ncbi:hypothetical protein SDRG_03637 [Saprolegnia diclina VS20]|uniref:Uncharacterized protein n=1 Tax=Saprolegnia diclina (strain VS20) TaxID=1156394 RepID=T0QZG6_SAPDV|nr:hypothetical protein SDRG_03637 [Saprolegnia diclina VS20]EQC39435.1 hypothetical protein SDRG_03637 [Saprolegnia diclina VS20]|eukprot:XP_008607496.1 hypothetical protein SDRG_03637 [Saprolegnia diclina VS20]